MPGSNPVSSNPISGTTQSKSLRGRFGFGSVSSSNTSSKSSFFSQLNLKPSKKSLSGLQDQSVQEQAVVLIDSPSEKSLSSNEVTTSGQGHKGSKSQDFDSLSKAAASRIKHVFTHSLPRHSTSGERPRYPENTGTLPYLDNSLASERLLADISGLSKQLPDFSADLPLIINEQPLPDTTSSHSELENESQISALNLSPGSLNHKVTVHQNIGQSKTVKEIWLEASEGADSLDSSMLSNASGPVVTSTPFHSRRVSHTRPQDKNEDVSLDLDALDPELVALLPSNNSKEMATSSRTVACVNQPKPASTSISEPRFLESPPTHTFFRLPVGQRGTFSSSYSNSRFSSIATPVSPPSPLRSSFRSQGNVPSHAPQPTAMYGHIPWLEIHKMDNRQPSPGPSTVTSSDLGTPSDISKYASPLSAPLSKDETQHKRDLQSVPTALSSASSDIRRNAFAQDSNIPHSDSRSSSQLVQAINRPASTSPALARPLTESFGSIDYERDQVKAPIEQVSSIYHSGSRMTRPNSVLSDRLKRPRGNSATNMSQLRDYRDYDIFTKRRLRKRSMSLDQAPSAFQEEAFAHEKLPPRFQRVTGDGTQNETGYSEHRYAASDYSGPTSTFRDIDKEKSSYGREQAVRINRDWLGPRTARAFAAAGLLDDSRDSAGSRYAILSRSMNEREYAPHAQPSLIMHDQIRGGFSSAERDRDRDMYSIRYSDRDYRSPGMCSGAISPSISNSSRPLSRADSWSHSRPTTLFSRTMSDLASHQNNTRDSLGSIHLRPGSSYSCGGLQSGSAGSGGGRNSPTTANPLTAIQSLKEKHDTQTGALLAALADSQNICRELRTQNETLKIQLQELEERLAESIANVKQKEKELFRVTRAKRQYSPECTRLTSSNRVDYRVSRPPSPTKPPVARPQPGSRRASSSSSIFPTIPKTMSLLMAERPDTPGSLESNHSSPPSPTLVLPKLTGKERAVSAQGSEFPLSVPRTHKRSISGASAATSTNFSFETGSPGSLKLKPEHELLLGDITQLSLVSEIGDESED